MSSAPDVGGDGFFLGRGKVDRRDVPSMLDGPVTALQRRGLVCTAYAADTFRGHLQEL